MRELLRRSDRNILCIKHIAHPQAEALHVAAHAGDPLRIGQMHKAEQTVELTTNLQQPHHGQGFAARILDPRLIAPCGSSRATESPP